MTAIVRDGGDGGDVGDGCKFSIQPISTGDDAKNVVMDSINVVSEMTIARDLKRLD